MAQMLLLGSGRASRSQMGLGLARQFAPATVTLMAADVVGTELDPQAVAVMAEVGIDIAHEPPRPLAELNVHHIDLVIALTQEAAQSCAVLPGAPIVLRWELPDPLSGGPEGVSERFRAVRDELHRRLKDFFEGGYLTTMLALKNHEEVVLDHFSDGIIVHDAQRVIRWFNKAAERITGYDRDEVVGRDCWEVFPGRFCGEKCLFRDQYRNFNHVEYPLKVIAKDGQEHRVEVSVIAMKDHEGVGQGVMARFRDVTEVTQLRHQLRAAQSFHGIIGRADEMHAVFELIRDLAASDCPVLIQGESGTGKELVANAIHGESPRAGRPFVSVNCGALPEGILESELFGHVRGAFTGAIRDKKGRFELADKGALFLDEVAELSPNMQVKLLRVLQDGTFERVGGEQQIHVDVRLISATNKDLRKLVSQGKFREDLYYRLCVVPVNLPLLRNRRNDIPLLVEHFMNRFRRETGVDLDRISPDALHQMIDYHWPGNIRELQNAIQYAFVKCKGNILGVEDLPPEIAAQAIKGTAGHRRRQGKLNAAGVSKALKKTRGNKLQAAQLLGVGRATLYRFLNEQKDDHSPD